MRDIIHVNQSTYFTVRAAADLLDRSVITVRRWIEHGELTAFQPGRNLLIKQRTLLQFVRRSRNRRSFPEDAAERIRRAARRAAERERARYA